jgi:hypothetical protein
MKIARARQQGSTTFKGYNIQDIEFKTTSFKCKGCSNACEVVQFYENNDLLARWGDRYGGWEI